MLRSQQLGSENLLAFGSEAELRQAFPAGPVADMHLQQVSAGETCMAQCDCAVELGPADAGRFRVLLAVSQKLLPSFAISLNFRRELQTRPQCAVSVAGRCQGW